MKSRCLFLAAAIALGASVAWIGFSPAQTIAIVKKAEIGAPAPDFTLPDAYGKKYSLAEFAGKIVVLEWINQKCPISHGKHTDHTMQNTYKKYAKKGVVWLAIDSSHYCAQESNRVYAAEQMLSYPILHDPKGTAGRLYAAQTTPHMFVVDKNGALVYDGAIDDQKTSNYVAEALDALLAGKPVEESKAKPYGCSVKYARPAK